MTTTTKKDRGDQEVETNGQEQLDHDLMLIKQAILDTEELDSVGTRELVHSD